MSSYVQTATVRLLTSLQGGTGTPLPVETAIAQIRALPERPGVLGQALLKRSADYYDSLALDITARAKLALATDSHTTSLSPALRSLADPLPISHVFRGDLRSAEGIIERVATAVNETSPAEETIHTFGIFKDLLDEGKGYYRAALLVEHALQRYQHFSGNDQYRLYVNARDARERAMEVLYRVGSLIDRLFHAWRDTDSSWDLARATVDSSRYYDVDFKRLLKEKYTIRLKAQDKQQFAFNLLQAAKCYELAADIYLEGLSKRIVQEPLHAVDADAVTDGLRMSLAIDAIQEAEACYQEIQPDDWVERIVDLRVKLANVRQSKVPHK